MSDRTSLPIASDDSAPTPEGVRWYTRQLRPVEAVQLTEDADWEAIAAWCGGRLVNHTGAPGAEPVTFLELPTRGEWDADLGNWVVKRGKGFFTSEEDEDFRAEYQPAIAFKDVRDAVHGVLFGRPYPRDDTDLVGIYTSHDIAEAVWLLIVPDLGVSDSENTQ